MKAKRRMPDMRKIKKHSDIVHTNPANRLVVGGTREKTETGYRISGYAGKSFETLYEVMLPSTSTNVFKSKGERTYRLISGTIYVIVYKKDSQETRKLIPGDEVAIAKNTSHRLATSTEQVEMFICQTAGYDASVTVVEPAVISKPVPPGMLDVPTLDQRISEMRPQDMVQTRKGSKAKEQLKAQKSGRKSDQLKLPESTPEPPNRQLGLNPKPTGGHFSEEGAG